MVASQSSRGSTTTEEQRLKKSVGVDVERYQSLLDSPDIPDGMKREFLKNLWLVIMSIIDLEMGVHPVQRAKNNQVAHRGSGFGNETATLVNLEGGQNAKF